jgi:hypothetical protein
MPIVKKFLAHAALVVASLLLWSALLFAAGEIYLQTQYGSLPPGPPVEWNVYDARRGWTLKPGHYSYFNVQALRGVDVVINELGLRNGPLSREPEPGVERVTVLGDSFVFAPSLNNAETITYQLQGLAGSSFEVVNVSAPGYGTGQEYRFLEDLQAKGYRLGRKLVIMFFTNDVLDNLGLDYSTLERRPWQPIFSVDASGNLQQTVPRPFKVDRAGGVRRGLLARSLFLPFLRYHIEVLLVSRPSILNVLEAVGITPGLPRTPGIVAAWYGPQWETMWRVTEGVLEHMVRTIRAMHDAPELFIAFVPSPFQVHESFRRTIEAGAASDARYASFLSDSDRPQRTLRSLARRLDVPFIDLTPEVRQAAAHSLMYFPREGHFNQAGCAIAAKVIYEQVIQKQVAGRTGLQVSRHDEHPGTLRPR